MLIILTQIIEVTICVRMLMYLYHPSVIVTCVRIHLLITVHFSSIILVLLIFCGMHVCCVLLIN